MAYHAHIMNYRSLIAATFVTLVAPVNPIDDSLPAGWMKHGTPAAIENCVVGVDHALRREGTPNITLRCRPFQGRDHIGVSQWFVPSDYFGRRVRFSADVRTEGVTGGARLWLRVEAPSYTMLDNMEGRELVGTNAWAHGELVVDVPEDTRQVALGILLAEGAGQVWVRALRFEAVDGSVDVTGRRIDLERSVLERGPVNMGLQ